MAWLARISLTLRIRLITERYLKNLPRVGVLCALILITLLSYGGEEQANSQTPQSDQRIYLPIILVKSLSPSLVISAKVETDPVTHSHDAADDPAIWIHPTDPALSLIIGTDKQTGLEVYNLSGHRLQSIPIRTGNVDVRYNFPIGGQKVALVITYDRTNKHLGAFKVDEQQRRLVDVHDPSRANVSGGGIAMYHSPVTGKFYYLCSGGGVLSQYELSANASGKVGATLVRTVNFGTRGLTEGVVADDILKAIYVSEETVAIWKLGAEPGDSATKTMVDKPVSQGGHFTPDAEGLAIYYRTDGTGYLLLSNQGTDSYNVYRREGNNDYIGAFTVTDSPNGIDGTSNTDGIDVTNFPLGPTFPYGLFAVQDGINFDGGVKENQNFKLVPFELIASTFGLSLDTSWDPRSVGR